MKCPGCGYENLDLFETCKHCGPPPVTNEEPPGSPPADPEDDLLSLRFEVEEGDLGRVPSAGSGFVGDDDGPPFQIEDDLFVGHLPEPAFFLPGEEHGAPAVFEPIIDRDDEVPERYWAPEVAGLGRRALALVVDQLLLAALLGMFFLGALLALQRNGLTNGFFLDAAGLQASALPFALLAALLSLAYSVFFHGFTGRTPGKALAGIEVRTGDGAAIGWDRAILRWLGAALGLACAGVGIVWALFEPRRRGWADLISGTVVALPRRGPGTEVSRR